MPPSHLALVPLLRDFKRFLHQPIDKSRLIDHRPGPIGADHEVMPKIRNFPKTNDLYEASLRQESLGKGAMM